MKYIKLFEDFNTQSEMVFDWFPYDAKKTDPIQSQIPQELTLNELENYAKTAPEEIKDLGLFIAHNKQGSGFDRIILTNPNPLMFELSKFDENYEKKAEFKDLDITKISVKDLSKGVSTLSRFGLDLS